MAQLLTAVPIHSPRRVQELFGHPEFEHVSLPDEIEVHCDHQKCGGIRLHRRSKADRMEFEEACYYFAAYSCVNCKSLSKVFGLKAEREAKNALAGICTKIYQEPPFGQPIPKRLFELIGEANREHFLQARRAIARGLGIGAYAYYRRIIENTKFDLVSSVLEVAKAIKAEPAQVQLLQRAQSEKQFSKAIELLGDISAIPAVLLIDGQNPLALLHDLLSEGIHQLDDSECLARAQEAEIILCEIADRMQIALTEKKNVKAALASIMNRKAGAAHGQTGSI